MVKPTEEFTELLRKARDVSFIVAASLTKRGHRVRILPSSWSSTIGKPGQYVDDGDLEITQRVEVKHWPQIDFQSLDDVPYSNIIVDEAYKIEKRHELPLYAYIIVNASMTGYLLIPVWTRQQWFRESRHDRREGHDREFYFCPRDLAHFMRMRLSNDA